MEQVIGFLILIALVVFFLPVSQNTKIKRLNNNNDYFSKIKVEKALTNNWYKDVYIVQTLYGRYKFKVFICFGYTNVYEEIEL